MKKTLLALLPIITAFSISAYSQDEDNNKNTSDAPYISSFISNVNTSTHSAPEDSTYARVITPFNEGSKMFKTMQLYARKEDSKLNIQDEVYGGLYKDDTDTLCGIFAYDIPKKDSVSTMRVIFGKQNKAGEFEVVGEDTLETFGGLVRKNRNLYGKGDLVDGSLPFVGKDQPTNYIVTLKRRD